MERLEPAGHDIVGIRADNPGPFTLSGTNSWVVGRNPAWLVDPGPRLASHLDGLTAEIGRRGGLGGIALTHRHHDHDEAVPAVRERFPSAPLAAGSGECDLRLSDGEPFGPLQAISTPGHTPDHLTYLAGSAALSGDCVLGEGSVFIAPDPGALSGYLRALERLSGLRLTVICPGHGPLVADPATKLADYIDHRLERERRLLAALHEGRREAGELLDAAWADAPAALRPAAMVTLAAHLDKLESEGCLPPGVERPARPAWLPQA